MFDDSREIAVIEQYLPKQMEAAELETYLKDLMQKNLPNLQILPSESAIICFQLASAAEALKIGNYLKESGIFAPAIRPPTVPTSRIRISLMATHQQSQIEKLVEVLQDFD